MKKKLLFLLLSFGIIFGAKAQELKSFSKLQKIFTIMEESPDSYRGKIDSFLRSTQSRSRYVGQNYNAPFTDVPPYSWHMKKMIKSLHRTMKKVSIIVGNTKHNDTFLLTTDTIISVNSSHKDSVMTKYGKIYVDAEGKSIHFCYKHIEGIYYMPRSRHKDHKNKVVMVGLNKEIPIAEIPSLGQNICSDYRNIRQISRLKIIELVTIKTNN